MATMIPATVPEWLESRAEKELFSVLRDGLDSRWTVFHAFKLLTRNRQDRFIQGEIDYLLFLPAAGLLVLEVKNGVLSYDGATGEWRQNGRSARDPFTQARTSTYELRRWLASRLHKELSLPFGYAVCLPDVFSQRVEMPPGLDPEICITARDFPHLQDRVLAILASFGKGPACGLECVDAAEVRRVLVPNCEYGATLSDRVGRTDRTIFALTEDQCRVLDFIRERRQALIRGCAGSGKTVMAVKKARELAASGKTVLLLAYNRLIGERLAESVKDLSGRVIADTYHNFCMLHLQRHGRLAPVRQDAIYWEHDIPEAFDRLLLDHPLEYDAVIIDEGQDFRTEYWLTILSMVKRDGHLYIFYDPRQNLFKTDMDFPIKEAPFVLNDDCRNSRKVFEALRPYAAEDMRLAEGAPEGEGTVDFRSPYPEVRLRQLRRILHHLIEEEGLAPAQVVVLGGHSMDKTCIGGHANLGGFTITEKPSTDDGPRVVHYHTYMKFKGCDADAVILLDVDPRDPRWSDEAMYTTISRARHMLYIIRAG